MSSQTILFLTVILLLAVIVYLLFKASLEKKNKELEVNEIIKKLDKKEMQFKTLFNNLSEFVFVIQDNKIIHTNLKVMEQTGYNESLKGLELEGLVHDEDMSKLKLMLDSRLINDLDNPKIQFRFKKSSGEFIWVEASAVHLLWDDKPSILMFLSDITNRRVTEDKLSYICYHDQLTGLFNRRFFEEELKRVDTLRNYPIGIVMIDVNGLKLINDAFGHASGDELIKTVSDLIQKELRSDDIVARIGGDEFSLIMTKVNEPDLISLKSRLEHSTKSRTIQDIPISIAIGYALKHEENIPISQVLNSADVMMYQNKLAQRAALRKEAIEIILHNLEKKYPEEREHAKRTSYICKLLGKQLGFSQTQLLELLTLGYYHDIGKIALQDNILNYKGSLDAHQWDNMKRHPETGYSILSSSNEFAPIADSVLSHHERWDGSGYPKGLRGDEIPFYARILAVAEAYDALTRDQPYRKAVDDEEALEIIKDNAGTQFDPKIVKALIRALI
ncbi:HD domain-containing phosphohydrolase [Acetoanaerobium noterae]|uniref:HD domain-containing phosphohydrolase n=1 Tax=Acetoanaerobium noterae TaxID=745369 RepID=UPI00333ED354